MRGLKQPPGTAARLSLVRKDVSKTDNSYSTWLFWLIFEIVNPELSLCLSIAGFMDLMETEITFIFFLWRCLLATPNIICQGFKLCIAHSLSVTWNHLTLGMFANILVKLVRGGQRVIAVLS